MRGSRTAALSTITLTGAAVLLVGCSGSQSDSTGAASDESASGRTGYVAGEPAGDSVLARDATAAQGAATKTSGSGGGLLADVPTERSVIATAEMTLRSEDVTATVNAIELIATSVGGFVSGRDISSNPDDPEGTRAVVVVRVPTAKLNAVIDQAQAEGDVVRVTVGRAGRDRDGRRRRQPRRERRSQRRANPRARSRRPRPSVRWSGSRAS